MHEKTNRVNGFTLIELLVVMALAGIVMTSIYSAYESQQKAHTTQLQIVDMQQNIRASLYIMTRDIRMAGYDPTDNANAGIVTAGANSINFTKDSSMDGDLDDSDENITYSLYDSGSDGDTDIGRKVGAGNNQPVAENIDALNFVYLDADNSVTTNADNVQSIQISIVARTARDDKGYMDSKVYRNKQNTVILSAPNDNFRRRLLTTTVKCRNIGL